MDKHMDAIMDNCDTAVMAIIDKDDCMHVEIHGKFSIILFCVGRLIVDLAKQNNLTLEQMGEDLNEMVDIIVKKVDVDD